jgi:hypothetical protein
MTMETTEVLASDTSVGAPTDSPLNWHQINWRHAERTARRLPHPYRAGNSGR